MKKRQNKLNKLSIYSLLVVFCLLTVACSSSSSNLSIEDSKLSSQILLKRQYPALTDKWSNQYLSQLNRNITSLLNLNNFKCKNSSQIILTDNKQLIANTIDKKIYLSTRMISQLRNESELVFILAHENAHISLCHLNHRHTKDDIAKLELAADRLALQIFAQLHYPSSTPLLLLNRLYRNNNLDPFNQTHPGLEQRIYSLRKTPPERYFSKKVNNQNFNHLKSRLRLNALR